jgi:transmembrane sensor
MDENRFYILGSKKLTGELSPDEAIELDLLFIRNPQFHEIYNNLVASFSAKKPVHIRNEQQLIGNLRAKLAVADPGYAAADTDVPVYPELEFEPTFWEKYRKAIMLSSLLIIIAVGVSRLTMQEAGAVVVPVVSENNISTKPGSKTQVKLPDGTVVYLNADSKLSYPDNFLGNTREVTLEGEAFFEVTANKAKPFIIHSKTMDIKVLGTVFNVKAYPLENTAEASLIKGAIEITLKNRRNEKIMLKPNEKITVSNQPAPVPKNLPVPENKTVKFEEPLPIISVDQLVPDKNEHIIREIGWTKNKLMFRNETLESMIVTMERWYGRDIEIRTEKLKEKRFTANFTGESFMQVLIALQASSGFNIKRENNLIIIY